MKAFVFTLLWGVFIVDAVLLVLIVLLQSGRGGGISGMLGGGGGAESALGPKSGLNKITGWMAGIFFAAAILIGLLSREEGAIDVETGTSQEAPAAADEPKETPVDAKESPKTDAATPDQPDQPEQTDPPADAGKAATDTNPDPPADPSAEK